MSPLTKALVVLVTLLSVVFVALVVPYVAKTSDYKDQVATLKNQLATAQTKAQMTEQDIQHVYEKTRNDIASLTAEKAQLQSQIDTLTAQLATSQGQSSGLQKDIAVAKADMARLSAATEQATKLLDEVSQDLKESQEAFIAEKTRAIQLEDAQTKLTGQVAAMTRQLRRMREAMVALEDENRSYASKLAGLPQADAGSQADTQSVVFAGKPIQGSVEAVEKISDVTLVLVNVGTSDGVKENMKFNIHRGGKFVGNMVVETVDTADSSGRVTLAPGTIQIGDQITAATF